MHILRIEHPVRDFDAWKKAFESDPVGRERSGVRRYTISRLTGASNHVTVDLEFDSFKEAETVRAALQELWPRVEAEGLIGSPQAKVLEAVERKEY